jgi:glucose-6-phosphate 1-dehydrogenase
MANIELGFAYKDFFEMQPSTGYETLIYDCLTGDQTLFQRADNIENGWRAVQPFLDAWQQDASVQTMPPVKTVRRPPTIAGSRWSRLAWSGMSESIPSGYCSVTWTARCCCPITA